MALRCGGLAEPHALAPALTLNPGDRVGLAVPDRAARYLPGGGADQALRAGVLHCRDHYGKLRHQTAVTGKVWAISIHPERQLAGTAEPVRVTRADLKYDWRNLDADAESGRTVWNLTRSEEQKAAYKAQRRKECRSSTCSPFSG